ncbi:T-cell ecto-ADP-ribosyltransferase 2-like [Trichomycterus rosablanca]|uniref:T-cell ecto-ADP-ribosyltransferase 2-like n=1 Tax=Trichomycterus rosablanca TaxID=2290929 RepID=UPI002F3578D9
MWSKTSIIMFFTILVFILPVTSGPYQLDMASDSVDDQYEGCEKYMQEWIKKNNLQEELKSNENCTIVWENFENIKNITEKIIKMYTVQDFYSEFNAAVSTRRTNYTNEFKYKTFHYLLTRAVQNLTLNECTDVYRKTTVSFVTNVTGQEMRFDRFASTSLIPNLEGFGNKSCFKIHTCFGANIANFSILPGEQEVLIPPYEVFNITNVTEKQEDCDVLYTLQSTRRFSNMNCTLVSTSNSTS